MFPGLSIFDGHARGRSVGTRATASVCIGLVRGAPHSVEHRRSRPYAAMWPNTVNLIFQFQAEIETPSERLQQNPETARRVPYATRSLHSEGTNHENNHSRIADGMRSSVGPDPSPGTQREFRSGGRRLATSTASRRRRSTSRVPRWCLVRTARPTSKLS